MDLRAYYRKLRAVEAELEPGDIILSSLETPEGGREGVLTEAPREVAAKLISEGRARVTTKDEAAAYLKERRAAKEAYDREQAARRVQVVVLPSAEPRAEDSRKPERN